MAVGRVYDVLCNTGVRACVCLCVCARVHTRTHIPVARSQPVFEITKISDLELFFSNSLVAGNRKLVSIAKKYYYLEQWF